MPSRYAVGPSRSALHERRASLGGRLERREGTKLGSKNRVIRAMAVFQDIGLDRLFPANVPAAVSHDAAVLDDEGNLDSS